MIRRLAVVAVTAGMCAAAAASTAHASHVRCGYITVSSAGSWDVYAHGPTSCAFASNVGETFFRRTLRRGSPPRVVRAYSPVTHRFYTMRCRVHSGMRVSCSGGDHALVVLELR